MEESAALLKDWMKVRQTVGGQNAFLVLISVSAVTVSSGAQV
jgi:hypothetical protein